MSSSYHSEGIRERVKVPGITAQQMTYWFSYTLIMGWLGTNLATSRIKRSLTLNVDRAPALKLKESRAIGAAHLRKLGFDE